MAHIGNVMWILDCAIIAMIGDDCQDYLARTPVKWLHKQGVNVMTMSPQRKAIEEWKRGEVKYGG